MQQTKMMEIAVGFFIACGMAALFVLAMKVSNIASIGDNNGYVLTAHFDNIGGLKVRAPVTVSGVRIGRVTGVGYDEESYQAVVTLKIEDKFRRLPVDSTANIYTAGLLGEQYVALQPGFNESYLKNGGVITHTQSALVMEQLIGQFLFQKASEGSSK
jgi:phospholipid/cholesterol/gamma-HCH transport system substrate-binding protein